MKAKRLHYPRTTASQRRKLFEVWEATKDVKQACHVARMSERSFYYWKPRFESGGYAALEQFAKHGPKQAARISPDIEQMVITHRKRHPTQGKRRIADELAKANNWQPLVTPNTVRRILQDAGLWHEPESNAPKKGGYHLNAEQRNNLGRQ
jgi:transposase